MTIWNKKSVGEVMSLMETMNIGQKSLQAHGARIKIHAKNLITDGNTNGQAF